MTHCSKRRAPSPPSVQQRRASLRSASAPSERPRCPSTTMVRERRWWSIPRMPPPPAWLKRRDVSSDGRGVTGAASQSSSAAATAIEGRPGGAPVDISAPLEAAEAAAASDATTTEGASATPQDECIPSISFSFFSEAEQLFSSTLLSTVLKEESDEKNEGAETEQGDADELETQQIEVLIDPLENSRERTAEGSESIGTIQPDAEEECAETEATSAIERVTSTCETVLLGSDSSDCREGEMSPITPGESPSSLEHLVPSSTSSPPLSPSEPSSRPRTPPRPGPLVLSLSPSASRPPLSSPPSSPPPPPPSHPPPPPPFPPPPSADATVMQVRRSMESVTLGSNDSNGGYEVLRIRATSPASAPDTFPSLSTEDAMRRLSSEPPQYASPRISYIQDGGIVTSRGAPTCSPVGWKCAEPYSLSDSYLCYEMTTTNSGSAPCSEAQSEAREYEDLEYVAVRAGQRRATLLRGASGGGGRALTTVRVGRAWRALRGWWRVERSRFAHAVQRHARAAQAAAAAATTTTTAAPDTEESDAAATASPTPQQPQPPPVPGPRLPPSGTVLRRRRDDARHRPVSRAGLVRSRYIPEGQNGFEELRRYIKQGGDFCKDLTSILQERSEAENQYAKTLSKLSCKLLKASKDSVGSVNQAWQRAGAQMEAQSEAHRAFAAALSEEVVKPLRQLIESQHRIRKSVESVVDKTAKSLTEWRTAEAKSKKQSFLSARENEKLQDVTLDVRLGRNTGSAHAIHNNHKQVSDKECAKLESKRRKAEEHVKKSDVEYYTFCIRAERARLEWETAVIRGSHCFQALEEERLQQLKDLAACYLQHLQDMGPKLIQSTEKLVEPVQNCDIANDIQTVVSIKGTGQPIPEQLLPDFYAEHITLAMNRERRRQALVKILQLIRQDLERERRGKQGVESLARALQQTPNFGAEDSQQNLSEKLHHMRSMLTYLEAARYKVHSALVEIDGRARGSHPLAPHIQVTRDKQGLQQSVLKVPPWVRKESLDQLASDSPDWTDRGAGDGNSVQPDSDFDEFSSQGSEKDYQSSVMTYPVISECNETPPSPRSQCRALYEYAANLYDELNLRPGDIINIHNKQADGWWLGELNGIVGIFPATYVEEM